MEDAFHLEQNSWKSVKNVFEYFLKNEIKLNICGTNKQFVEIVRQFLARNSHADISKSEV